MFLRHHFKWKRECSIGNKYLNVVENKRSAHRKKEQGYLIGIYRGEHLFLKELTKEQNLKRGTTVLSSLTTVSVTIRSTHQWNFREKRFSLASHDRFGPFQPSSLPSSWFCSMWIPFLGLSYKCLITYPDLTAGVKMWDLVKLDTRPVLIGHEKKDLILICLVIGSFVHGSALENN